MRAQRELLRAAARGVEALEARVLLSASASREPYVFCGPLTSWAQAVDAPARAGQRGHKTHHQHHEHGHGHHDDATDDEDDGGGGEEEESDLTPAPAIAATPDGTGALSQYVPLAV